MQSGLNLFKSKELLKKEALPSETSYEDSKLSHLKPFDVNEFFTIKRDDKLEGSKYPFGAQLSLGAVKLVVDYYKDKYLTEIIVPETTLLEDQELRVSKGLPSTYLSEKYFFDNVESLLKEARSRSTDTRVAFLVGVTSDHTVPIIYIKEDNTEAILYANSKYLWDGNKLEDLSRKFEESSRVDEAVILAIQDTRQADYISCCHEAILFARDATGKNPETKEFIIPNLLTQLAKRARGKEEDAYLTVLLPPHLLKTAQISKFVKDHSRDSDLKVPIHQAETLEKFRNRYTENVVVLKRDPSKPDEVKKIKKDISSYLKIKGLKYVIMAEIQFYLQQFKKIKPDLITEEVRKQFIFEAKKLSKKNVLKFEEESGIVRLQKNDQLYEFANDFIQGLLLKAKKEDSSEAFVGLSIR